jgi:phosphatidylinositol alpha-1,6-mannosyltransferase
VARSLPEALLLTPDFPPARGGIQLLLGRLVADATRVRFRVVTVDPARRGAGRTAAIAGLNVRGVAAGLRRRPDVILSGHIVTSPAAAALARGLRRPVVQYVYALEVPARPRLARFAVSRADAVIALSEYGRELAVGAGARPDAVHVIPPGVGGEAPAEHTLRDGARPPRIVTVSRLGERYKGHDVIARALPLVRARVPDAEWVVIGDGPLRGHLEDLARTHGIDGAVRLAGEVTDEERDRLLAQSDVFAMPSRLPADGAGEGFGIAYLEAGLHGLPVVAGAVGGALDAVRDGETGLLVDPTDHVAVADALVTLLSDPQLAERLGRAGAEHARRFGWGEMVRRVEDVLLEACGSSS